MQVDDNLSFLELVCFYSPENSSVNTLSPNDIIQHKTRVSNIHLKTKEVLELPTKETQIPGEAEAGILNCKFSLSYIMKVCLGKQGRNWGRGDYMPHVLQILQQRTKPLLFFQDNSQIR